MDLILHTEEVKFSYVTDEDEKVTAVNGLNIDIEEGKFVAILGKNGSGKSTFAKLINALMVPESGKVYTYGYDTTDEEKTLDIRKKAGMVFQNPDNQLVTTLVEEEIAFGPENLGIEREEIIRRIDYALNTVGMQKYRNHSPSMLSGGQKQRIAIAGVLAMMPNLIIFDESTAMLDPQGRKDIVNLIYKLNREEKISIILITHYMEEAVNADKIFVMKDGKVLREGVPDEIFFDRELLGAADLKPTFESQLIMDLRDNGVKINNTLNSEVLGDEICQLL